MLYGLKLPIQKNDRAVGFASDPLIITIMGRSVPCPCK